MSYRHYMLIPYFKNNNNINHNHNHNVICGIYIVLYSARSCSAALYNLIIPGSNLFPYSTNLNSKGTIQRMLRFLAQSVTQSHSHRVLSDTHFYG